MYRGVHGSAHEDSKRRTCQEQVVYKNVSECQKKRKKCVPNMFLTCSELGIFMYRTGNSVNNLSSYYGLTDLRMMTSEKD